MLGLAANGEGQPKHPQDPGQDPGAKQLEGNIQPDADAVEAEAEDGWMLVNACRKRLATARGRPGHSRRWRHLVQHRQQGGRHGMISDM